MISLCDLKNIKVTLGFSEILREGDAGLDKVVAWLDDKNITENIELNIYQHSDAEVADAVKSFQQMQEIKEAWADCEELPRRNLLNASRPPIVVQWKNVLFSFLVGKLLYVTPFIHSVQLKLFEIDL